MTHDPRPRDGVTPRLVPLDPGTGDAELAARLAREAGRLLLGLREEVDAGTRPAAVDDLRRDGDALSQAFLAAALGSARPTDAVLSEEGADDPRRAVAERVWIVDPLDGTREFAERRPDGSWRDDWAVHVALWRRGAGVTDAAVALPAGDRVVRTDDPPRPDAAAAAAVLAGARPLRVAVSRTRPPACAARIGARDDVELVPTGSSGAKIAAVLLGAVDAYVHAGGQYEWDTAAPVAVALAGGFTATRLDGSRLTYNHEDPWSPDLLVCHPALHARLRALLEAAGVGAEVAAGR